MTKKFKSASEKKRPGWYAAEWIAYLNLKQSDVVARTGMSKGMVSEYVNGKRRYNEDVLVSFSKALGIEPADILMPPEHIKSKLSEFVMSLDTEKQEEALRVLKALEPSGSNRNKDVA
jgi:transcriptional regulator with XRE-family HTH domain